MIQLKAFKFKHLRRAEELSVRIKAKEHTTEDIIRFTLDLVAEWDFVDAETGAALAVGELDELSIEQIDEILTVFNEKVMGPDALVPKANAGHSRSTSARSKKGQLLEQPRQAG